MTGSDYIIEKQRLWAQRAGICLQGSKGNRGRALYTKSLNANLLQPPSATARKEFQQGDGSEIHSKTNAPAKMQALHSSSAIAANVFGYWKDHIDQAWIAAKALRIPSKGISSICFEQKLPILRSSGKRKVNFHPNIDVLIEYEGSTKLRAVGVECKLTEPFGHRNTRYFAEAYLETPQIWEALPNLRKLATRLNDPKRQFPVLDAPQLIKHILGLTHRYGLNRFRLVCLWYDAPGAVAVQHNDDLLEFTEVASEDGVRLHTITYQEMITGLNRYARPADQAYVHYLSSRYF